MLELLKNNTVVNWHEHVFFGAENKLNTEYCDKLAAHAKLVHFDTLAISNPMTSKTVAPETVEAANNIIADVVSRHPDVFAGMCFVDPQNGELALREIERCVNELGFVGVKLYHQCKLDDPIQYPIVEKCIELDIPILMHAGKLSTPSVENEPNLADNRQFYNIAQVYPEAVFIIAHIGGGGDWYWQLKVMDECPNVFIDISGSVYDYGIVEETVAAFGADRVLFGTDGSFCSGVGKLLGAELSDEDKITILGGPRFAKYLNRYKESSKEIC